MSLSLIYCFYCQKPITEKKGQKPYNLTEHHISYNPEIKVSVHKKCHNNIHHKGKKRSDETKKKISKSRKGTQFGEKNPNWKPKIELVCPVCGEIFERCLSQVKIGKQRYCSLKCSSKGTGLRKRGTLVGSLNSSKRPEVRAKISNALKGKVTISLEQRKNISKCMKGRFIGDKNVSKRPEVRQKISDKLKLYWATKKSLVDKQSNVSC